MIRFDCDYYTGAHPKVLEALGKANAGEYATYGYDAPSQSLESLLQSLCKANVKYYGIAGGTLCNLTLIRSCLRVYEGVFASCEGHITTHETGAIEATGHKVLSLPCGTGETLGKVTARQIEQAMQEEAYDPKFEHVVKPGMVYISQPTELGTLYTEEELEALSATCKKYGLLLYCDGARLASAIGYFGNEHFTILAKCCDAFSIGGTKCGALFGEALVVANPALNAGLRHVIKQSGALMAKGFIIAVQFLALLQDGLYEAIGKQCNSLALQIQKAFVENGYAMLSHSSSNQQFVCLPEKVAQRLAKDFVFAKWKQNPDGSQILRFVCNFSTTQDEVNALCGAIAKF